MADTLGEKQERLNAAMEVWQGRMGAGTNDVKIGATNTALLGVDFLNLIGSMPVIGTTFAGLGGGLTQVSSGFVSAVTSSAQFTSGLFSIVSLMEKIPGAMRFLREDLPRLTAKLKAPTLAKASGGGLTPLIAKLKASALATASWGKSLAMTAWGGLKAMGKGIASLIPKMVAWTATLWSAAAAHLAAFWPIYAIVGAVAAVIGIVVLLRKHWGSITAWFGRTWARIKGFFIQGFGVIMSLFTESPKWVQILLLAYAPMIAYPLQIIKHWGKIKLFFANLWESVKGGFVSFVDFIMAGVNKLIEPLRKIAEAVGGLFGKDSGEKLTSTMAEGVSQDTSLYDAAASNFSRVGRLTPRSDAKEGPFSRLTSSGRAIPATMAEGVRKEGALSSALKKSFEGTLPRFSPKGGSQGPTTNNYQVTVSFDELRDFPSLVDYLTLLKEETDRVQGVSA